MTPFGVSTLAFRSGRLGDREIGQAAATGFHSLAVAGSPGHFDPADAGHAREVTRAAAASGLSVESVSASLAGAGLALRIAVDEGWPLLIVRLGSCRFFPAERPTDLASVRPTLEALMELLPDGSATKIAVETPGSVTSPAEAVRELVASLDDLRLGICLDAGHAKLAGDVPEAAEALSGYLLSAHLHDNNGREDAHRCPGEGSIDWAAALTACWKTGFTGPWVIVPGGDGDRTHALQRAVGARTRLQAILEDLAQPLAFTE